MLYFAQFNISNLAMRNAKKHDKKLNMVWLFPFDSRGGFAGDIVNDAINAADFVYDSAGNQPQHLIRDLRKVGGHKVGGFDGADCDDVFKGSAIAHNADGLDGDKDGEGLEIFLYRPADLISSMRISSAARRTSRRLGVISPIMRTANPGPGKG